jgi:TetR/AcrR family transcriptional repressor of lmrAB and yxaGH operons
MQTPRDRLLTATEDLLRESGMSGTGIKDVVARSGAPIGSLYHYFPGGKTQLVTEALSIHADKSRQLFDRFFDGKATTADALRSIFNAAADGFERAGANKGCAIGAVTLDLARSDKEIREICRDTFDDWIAVIMPTLPFPDAQSRRSFATMVVAALEGGFIVARASRSGEPLRDIGKCLAAMTPADS